MRIRTGMSFRTAIGKNEDVVARLKAIGWNYAPISDRLSTFGFNKYTKVAKAAGLKPIYGVELCVGDGDDFWSFFSISNLRPLHDLIWLATSRDGRPRLTIDQAVKAEGLVKIIGSRFQLAKLGPDVQTIAEQPDVFLALAPSLPLGLARRAKATGFKFLASSDNAYVTKDQRELYRVALSPRADVQTYPQHIMDDQEWRQSIAHLVDEDTATKALVTRDAIMQSCHAELKHGTLLKPETNKTLRQLCEEGAQRTGTNLNDPVYAERLERELALIHEKQFEDYFFILHDIVNKAKEMMIVGPARGSACGSLVCYLLNITAVDPIPFNLLFERFIDVTRADLPDVDIDFSDERRHLLFEYVEQRYGKDHVARLGTVMVFRPRSLLNQAGAALRIPKWQVEKLADTVIERSSGDARALQSVEDTFTDTDTGRDFIKEWPEVRLMACMEGHPVVSGQHAAGIVITQEPIKEYVAVDARNGATMCDKRDAEEMNLLKIDALGLRQLSVFERTLELLYGKMAPRSEYFDKVPLDDQSAFDVLNKGHYSGVFQFNGLAMQTQTKMIANSKRPINHINDLINITAASRPGPVASGGAQAFALRRIGEEEVTTLHPLVTELTKDTYGIILFQEQVLRIGREIGNLSWHDVTLLRKAMSKSLGDEYFQQFYDKFRDGAIANGVDEKTARAIWLMVNTMGSWAFNLSHSVAYGLVSYYCCYLKSHHPVEFAAATLDAEHLPGRQIAILRELHEEGISYRAFDRKHSTERWTPHKLPDGKQILIGPLTSIKGIGPASVKAILDERNGGPKLKPGLLKRLKAPETEISTLYPIRDAIARLHPSLPASGIETIPTPCIDVQVGIDKEIVVLGVAERLAPLDVNEPIRVQRRNGRVFDPPTKALNVFFRDDSDRLLCRIDRFNMERLGKPILEHGKPGKALYALKGFVPKNFRMLMVERVKFLGDMDESHSTMPQQPLKLGDYRPGGIGDTETG